MAWGTCHALVCLGLVQGDEAGPEHQQGKLLARKDGVWNQMCGSRRGIEGDLSVGRGVELEARRAMQRP